ncbi:hypothetical protein H2201_006692 [Coniosporium apollinis]|uniref:Uncharacterized protein n=1 Tax=Coniosporium apollinis TaxID=61459 RepID=A0ABQ9NMT2_9PEZI|nr:hypothetical protein H2201_006692 [Coniosporium apollinis]
MSPTSFVTSAESLSPIKRRAHLPTITENQAKRLCLRPPPLPTDRTISEYTDRISSMYPSDDRPTIQVAIPFEKTWKDVRNELSSLKAQNADHEKRITNQGNTIVDQGNTITALQDELTGLKAAIDQVAKRQAPAEKALKEQLALCAGNAIIKLAGQILERCPGETDHSTHRLKQVLPTIPPNKLHEMNVPSKYFPFLRRISEVIDARNISAHNTPEAFAQLLLSEAFRNSSNYFVWKDIFPVVYGASIEKVAARGDGKSILDEMVNSD